MITMMMTATTNYDDCHCFDGTAVYCKNTLERVVLVLFDKLIGQFCFVLSDI